MSVLTTGKAVFLDTAPNKEEAIGGSRKQRVCKLMALCCGAILATLGLVYEHQAQAQQAQQAQQKQKTEDPAKIWETTLPQLLLEKPRWRALINYLSRSEMDFGAIAGAYRMLLLFKDIDSKEYAYESIIRLTDRAYPFSARHMYIIGDIDPKVGYNFTNSYNLYKGIVNRDKGMMKWADDYFKKVDQEKFTKYLFFKSIDEYSQGHLEESIKLLRQILSREDMRSEDAYLMSKVARTLARIYFEQKKFEMSLEIYEEFLLKVNPLNPSDWLEAAWNLYYLKRPSRALGYLYNLESSISGHKMNLEKYAVRALIYRDNCLTKNMAHLSESFHKDFGEAVVAIKEGKDLNKFSLLHKLNIPQNESYYRALTTLEYLKKEAAQISDMPDGLVELARYLYRSEIQAIQVYLRLYRDEALENSAEALVTLAESLKFLEYEVAREKYNPERVFNEEETNEAHFKELSLVPLEFRLFWRQFDDYWRDERMSYLGGVRNRCGE